jgi:Toprim-like
MATEWIITPEADLIFPKRSGKWIRAYCHIHGGDHQRSLSINSENGFGKCQNCGAQVFVPELNLDGELRPRRPVTAASLLRPVQPPAQPEPTAAQREELNGLVRLADRMRARLADDRPRAYLAGRGIPYEVAVAAGVGYIPADARLSGRLARWRDRLMFPLGSPAGAGFAGRLLTGWQPAMDEDAHKQLLDARGAHRWLKTYPAGFFGYDHLTSAEAVLAEGTIDSLALQASGLLPDTPIVALVGTACRPDLLPRGLRAAVIALDGDPEGVKRSATLARDLSLEGIQVVEATPPDDGQGKDWSARWRISGHAGLWPVAEALDRLLAGC